MQDCINHLANSVTLKSKNICASNLTYCKISNFTPCKCWNASKSCTSISHPFPGKTTRETNDVIVWSVNKHGKVVPERDEWAILGSLRSADTETSLENSFWSSLMFEFTDSVSGVAVAESWLRISSWCSLNIVKFQNKRKQGVSVPST